MYRYALLNPAPTMQAAAENAAMLGPNTLGIEVTVPSLAERCGLGNIDPQHQPEGGTQSAIEACLDIPPPPAGAALVTIRPDLDAFGAMALLTLRAERRQASAEVRSRVHDVGRADRFDYGPWPGARPLPLSSENLSRMVFKDSAISLLSAAMRDDQLTAAQRVDIAKRWLATGALPKAYARELKRRAETLFAGLESGEIEIKPCAGGQIASITSSQSGALKLGYLIAPVVVAENPIHEFGEAGRGRKYTVAQWAQGYADLDAVANKMNRHEPGWGGSQTIKGSPQDRPSQYVLEQIINVVTDHLQEKT